MGVNGVGRRYGRRGFLRVLVSLPGGTPMPAFTVALADHLGPHHGVVSDPQLRQLGISRSQRERLVDQQLLIPMLRGVYRLRSTPETLDARCLAVCLAYPESAITGCVGGRLWGLRRMGTDPLIDVRIEHFKKAIVEPGVRFRRCNVLEEIDVVRRPDGINVVSPPRLAFDLGAVVSDLDLESVIEQILDRRWCTIETLHLMGRRLVHPSRPGSARFARVIGSRPAWLKPADSHLEVRLFDALRSAGVAGLVRQHRIDLPGGWSIHADVAVPQLQWAIPIDHVTWHGGRADAQRDKQNDRQARMLGWQVDRVTDDDIERRWAATTAELLQLHDTLLRTRGRRSA